MKIAIVSVWERLRPGSKVIGPPPLTTVLLAALCPPHVRVQVWHESIRPLDLDIDADIIALSAMTPSARRMYWLANHFRRRGSTVILGGPHVSLLPDEALPHADAIVVGDGEHALPRLIRDFERGELEPVYREEKPISLAGLPVPRYDLYEGYPLRCFVQATRGCPHRCDFCTLKSYDAKYRVRPVDEVIRDIQACEGRNALERKLVMFVDDNLTANRAYATELFGRLKPLKKWWYSQCSIDVANDPELVRLAAESGCIALFIGFESFSQESLSGIRKHHNQIAQYRRAIQTFHDHGIAVNAGLIIGLDGESAEQLRRLPSIVDDLGIDFPFLNTLIPFPKTPLYERMGRDGRLLCPGEWHRYRSGRAVYRPQQLSVDELESLYTELREELYSVRSCLRRMSRSALRTRVPSAVLGAVLHYHYGLSVAKKKLRRGRATPLSGSAAERNALERRVAETVPTGRAALPAYG